MSAPRRSRPPRGRGVERLRRNPRAEHACSEPIKQAEVTARVRRDPRAQRAVALLGPSQRLRIDRARPMTLVDAATCLPGATVPAVRAIIIENPACWVLAVPDLEGGRLSSHDRDAVGAARQLADALDGAVVAISFAATESLGAAGADRVLQFEHQAFQGYAPEARADALLAVMEALRPRHVVLPDSAAGGGDLGRRIASRFREALATHVTHIKGKEVMSRGDGGRCDYVREPTRVILVAAGAGGPVRGAPHEGRMLETPNVQFSSRITDLGPIAVDANAVPLAEAEFITAAGAGITDWDSFHALARACGAAEGGTRVVCDAGLLPRARQIGVSGTLVAPRCYLGLGISGAPQHLQGIARAETVIAVNTDPHAEVMRRADLAVVADVQQVMVALLRLLKEDRHDA